jgi:predicted enzyme related to lactoylglutathione lyase
VEAANQQEETDMAATDGMVKGVDFVAFQTKDFDGPDRGFAEFETGNLTLSIIDSAKMGMEHQASAGPVALHVDDVAQARTQLEDAGVQFRGDVLDTGVCHMAFFHDPDGNALMLHHRYAPRETDL